MVRRGLTILFGIDQVVCMEPSGVALDRAVPLAILPRGIPVAKSGTTMRTSSRPLPIFGMMLLFSTLLSDGCSALISYSGEDVGKLGNKEQVRESFGTPTISGNADGPQFDEYHTRRKISESPMAFAQLVVGVQSFGIMEIFNFPRTILWSIWNGVLGQDVRFEYGTNAEVNRILINGQTMEMRGQMELP